MARRAPDHPALSFHGEELTYAEVDARSNRLAHRLRRLGVGPGVAVAVCLERALTVPVALLGIFKAGGVFVPLDPSYPADRLAFMLADSAPPVLLSQEKLLGLFPDFAGELLTLETLDAALAAEPVEPLDAGVDMQDLAYVIYTSGSTGRPKGIAMTHAALANLIAFHLGRLTGAEARTLQFPPLSFDVCFQEMFSTWGAGGTLVLIADDDRRDPRALLAILERHDHAAPLHHQGQIRGARPRHRQCRHLSSAGMPQLSGDDQTGPLVLHRGRRPGRGFRRAYNCRAGSSGAIVARISAMRSGIAAWCAAISPACGLRCSAASRLQRAAATAASA